MLIGELANKTGCSRDTIRFYEKLGLVEAARNHNRTNRYKHYEEEMVYRIELVKKAKLLGFTLAEISRLIIAWEGDVLSHAEKIEIMQDKLVQVDQQIEALKQVKQYLEDKLVKLGAP